jgi:hypothetical protein
MIGKLPLPACRDVSRRSTFGYGQRIAMYFSETGPAEPGNLKGALQQPKKLA